MQRGRFLVNMVEERDKENIAPPITFNQHSTVEDILKMSLRDEVSSKETHVVLTPQQQLEFVRYRRCKQVGPENVMVPETGNEIKKNIKKRVCKPACGSQKLRNSVKAYQYFSKSKKLILERKVGPSRGDKCRLKCKDKVDEMSRQQVFAAYWALSDPERQRELIVSHLQQIKQVHKN
ncbi:hypothetical protein evm_011242 [Chilo suppressalis]|nr:hypothetical protein evm_011242 [Chilo suppressalis]